MINTKDNTDMSLAIEEEVSNIVIELYDANVLYHETNDISYIKTYIENYMKRVTRIAFRLRKTDLAVLRESCIIFHEILDGLNKSAQDISPEQLQQIETWPTLILAYLSNPDDKDNIDNLLALLQDPVWNYQASQNDLEQLQKEFYAAIKLPETTVHEEPTQEEENIEDTAPFDGVLFETVQEEILEAMTGLISDLSSVEEDDDFGLSHAFYLCADRIELLGMSIATAGLMGLMDVCMIFQLGLRQLAQRDKNLSEEEQIIIEEWTSYLISYLNAPTDHVVVDQLVDYLSRIPWSETISENEAMTLRVILIPEDIEITAPEHDVHDEIENTTEQNITANKANDNTEELIYEMDDSDGLEDMSISEDTHDLGQELIQLIHDEFQLEQNSLQESIEDIYPDKMLSKDNIEKLTKFNTMIERFSLATESIGLTGLNKLLSHLSDNIKFIINAKEAYTLNENIVGYLKQFASNALNYLSDLDNVDFISKLTSPFYSSPWPIAFPSKQSDVEKECLSPNLVIEDDIEIRATQALPDDVSLKLPEDVNQQLLNTLLQELPVQAADFTQSITQLVEGSASLQDVERAQRIAHTLKGAANTVGIVGIATLTHHIEDIFNIFTNQQRLPSQSLSDVLMNAADVLEMMSETLLGIGEAPEQALNVLQQILDWANLLDQEGIPEDDAQIKLDKAPETTGKQDDDTRHLNEIATPTMLRVPAALMDELLRITGETIILSGQLQERLRIATEKTHLVHVQNTLYQQLVFELEQIVDVQGLSAKKADTKSDEVFDSLELEQYNELHTVTHRLVEAATDSKELTHNIEDELNTLDTLLVEQSRLNKESQNFVMQTRMVPVQNIVPRLQRSIRQTSRTTSKKIALNITGSETLMDSDVLDELIDPLMHVLRNAVDHGIENDREKSGKALEGNIELSFFRDGDHIVVKCIDDGSGLDLENIRKTAIKKNIIKEEQNLSDEELTRLIWLAGFTTREITTQISGRGIGMDAVYNQITSMKGTININSVKGKSCTVEFRLPVTLISVHAILVKLRKQTIAISNRGIEQILCMGDGEFKREKDAYNYYLNDEVFPAFDIETLLHQPRDQRNDDSEERTVFIVRDETGYQYAVSVEHVIANQDLIVKQLGSYIPDIIGIEGATILGDGSVAPVLDLPGLIRTSKNKETPSNFYNSVSESEIIEERLVALVVDDSLSARRSLAEFVKDIGYDVLMARDGIEAIEVIEGNRPDIILVDLEMPRMNGLELTSHLRTKVETKDIPVIMITSRSTEKHRSMADAAGINAYLTKPFSEDELLENIQNLLLPAVSCS